MNENVCQLVAGCPACKKRLAIPAEGTSLCIQCPCGHTFPHPRLSVTYKLIPCPACQKDLGITRKNINKDIQCPHCHFWIHVEREDFREEDDTLKEAKRVARDANTARLKADIHQQRGLDAEFRQERNALAKPQLADAAKSAMGMLFGALFWGGLIVFFVAKKWGRTGALVVVVGCLVGLVAAVAFLLKFPWYVFSVRASQNAIRAARNKAAHEKAEGEEAARQEAARQQTSRKQAGREGAHQRARKAWSRTTRTVGSDKGPEPAPSESSQRGAVAPDGNPPTREYWERISWWDFEIAVLLTLENRGYEAKATSPSDDGGVDGFLTKEGEHFGVQCKHFRSGEFVKVAEMRDFIGALHIHGIKRGLFVTTGKYSKRTRQTVELAVKNGITVQLCWMQDLLSWGNTVDVSEKALADAKKRWGVPGSPQNNWGCRPSKRRYAR